MQVDLYHLAQVLPEPVRRGVIPVHIFFYECFHGCGTLVLGPNGEHRNIITAAHLFSNGSQGIYFYKILQPLTQELFPIQVAKGLPSLKEDLAICRPGNQITPIFGFSQYRPGKVEGGMNGMFTNYLDPLPYAIHILSGEKIPVVGVIIKETGERYFVLAKKSFPGESGLGFLEPEHDNALYVLKGSVADRDDPAFFRLTKNYPHLSLAALMSYV